MKKRSLHAAECTVCWSRRTGGGALQLASYLAAPVVSRLKRLVIYEFQSEMAITQGRGNAVSVLVLVVALLAAVEAKNYNVGDATGWDYPDANDPGFYDTWASKQTFLPGDTLTFTYMPTLHDTVLVTADEYKSCALSATAKKYTTGKDVVTLGKPGTYYFYCSVVGHCAMGMKMKLTVGEAAAPVVAPVVAPVLAPTPAPLLGPAPVPVSVPAPVPVPVEAPAPVPVAAPAPVVVPVPVPVTSPAPAPEPASSGAVAVGVCSRALAAATGVLVVALFMF